MASSPDALHGPLTSSREFRLPNLPDRSLVQNKVPPLYFIVALLLVKSKPPKLSIEEYIASLRSYIVRSIHPTDLNTLDSHVDTASFWQQTSIRTEQENAVLKARVAELQSKFEESYVSQRKSSAGQNSQGKRKSPLGQLITLAARKRAKNERKTRERNHEGAVEAKTAQTVEGPTASRDKRNSDACLLYTFALKQSTFNPQATAGSICSNLHLLTYSMRQLLCSATKANESSSATLCHIVAINSAEELAEMRRLENIQEDLVTKITSLAPVFPHILQALDRLGQDPADQNLRQFAIYNIVRIFGELIGTICEFARKRYESTQMNHINGLDAPNGNASCPTASLQERIEHDNSNAARLSQLFIILLKCLRLADEVHVEVLEGGLFHLLGKVGQIVGWCMGEEQASNGNTTGPREGDDPEHRTANIEAQAPYLIWLLDRALYLRKESLGDSSGPVFRLSLLKLQNTLLNAAFGKDEEEKFETALRLPTLPHDMISFVRLNRRSTLFSTEEAFMDDVWKLFGWDALREMTRWPLGSKR